MDCIVHWVTKSRIRLSDLHITTGLRWGVGVCVVWRGGGGENVASKHKYKFLKAPPARQVQCKYAR